jgi:hypothetical protein
LSDYEIPTDIRKSLSTMYVHKTGCEKTFAASALEAWRTFFPQDLPGLSAPVSDALRLTHFAADPDAETQKFFCPVFTWEQGHMVALMFSDQSALVTRKTSDRLQALPVVFKIRKESSNGAFCIPVIRSTGKPQAGISFRLHARQTHLDIHTADDPDIRKAHGAEALEYIEGDLDKLAPLFPSLPYVRQPTDAAPCTADNTIDLSFLPHRWFSQEEAQKAQEWAIDVADWILMQHPEFAEVSFRIEPRTPDGRSKARFLGSPFRYLYKYKESHPHPTGSGSADALSFLEGSMNFHPPIPADRLYEMEFAKSGIRKHTVRASTITSGRRAGPISRHRELKLLARFSLR